MRDKLKVFPTIFGQIFIDVLILYAMAVDFANGALQEFAGLHTPIGMIFRGSILVYLLIKIRIDYSSLLGKLFRFSLFIYVLSLPIWFVSSAEFSLSVELGYLIRFLYFWVVIFYFKTKAYILDITSLAHIVFVTLSIFSLINIMALAFGFGVSSYGEGVALGVKGFYADGNSTSMYAVLSLFISAWYVLRRRKLLSFIFFIISTIGTMIVGTRMAIFGGVLVWIVLSAYVLLFSDKQIKVGSIPRLSIVLIFLFLGLYSMSWINQYMKNLSGFNRERYQVENLVSPRARLIESGLKTIDTYQGVDLLIGKGKSGGSVLLGHRLTGTNQGVKVIEADFHDQILFYGYGFGSLMCLLYIGIVWDLLKGWFERKSYQTFIALMVGLTFLIASYMGGHGFANVMLAPILGVAIVYSEMGRRHG